MVYDACDTCLAQAMPSSLQGPPLGCPPAYPADILRDTDGQQTLLLVATLAGLIVGPWGDSVNDLHCFVQSSTSLPAESNVGAEVGAGQEQHSKQQEPKTFSRIQNQPNKEEAVAAME